MKNFLYILILILTPLSIIGQCTIQTYPQWPTNNLNPVCGNNVYGSWVVVGSAYSREYSVVNVYEGSTYEFRSYRDAGNANQRSRFVTITSMDDDPFVWGTSTSTTSIFWTSTFTGQIKFWTHRSDNCDANTDNSVLRIVRCSTPPIPSDPISITASETTICVGTQITLTANGGVGTIYWFEDECSTVNHIGTGSTINVTPNSTKTYYVRNFEVFWSNGCASITINVNQPNPVIFVEENEAEIGDFIWNGQINSDWNEPNNWYIKTQIGYSISSTSPLLTDNVYIVPSYVGGDCISESNNPVVNVLTLGSGDAHDIFLHPDSELTLGENTTLNVSGDFYSYGSLTSSINSTVEFYGENNVKLFIDNPEDNRFYNIKLNKNNPDLEIELRTNIYVDNKVIFSIGNLRLNQLILDLGDTGEFENENENSYAYCDCPTARIRRKVLINANTQVNAGNLGLSIKPELDMGYVVVERFHEKIVQPLYNITESIKRYYSVKNINGGPVDNNGNLSAEIVFNYLNSELDEINGGLGLYHKETGGIYWDELGGFHNPTNKTVTYYQFQTFSFVTLGPSGTALPVELTFFNGKTTPTGNQLTWQTASEYNADYYILKHSTDGEFTNIITIIPATGTTNQISNYDFIHDRFEKTINYYQLIQVDLDGTETVYPAISIDNRGGKKLVKIINVMGQEVNEMSGGMYFEVYDDGSIIKIIK